MKVDWGHDDLWDDRRIKFREETLPTLRQTGESASLNLTPSPILASGQSTQLDPGLLRLGRLCLETRPCTYDRQVQLGSLSPLLLDFLGLFVSGSSWTLGALPYLVSGSSWT